MRSALALAASIGALPLLFVFATAASCSFPDYVAGASDATTLGDTSKDTGPKDTGPFTFPDGRTCTGHDEDGDGVPDSCDDCPNVSDSDQAGGAAIGAACAPGAAFIPSGASRLIFDPFISMTTGWAPLVPDGGTMPFTVGSDDDSFVGGTTADSDFRILEGVTGSAGSAIVATTVVSISDEQAGSAGILLRVTGSGPVTFFICGVSMVNGFVAAHSPDTGCSGGPCNPVAFGLPDAGATPEPAQLPIPASIPHTPGSKVGLRASITSGASSGTFECRVFDPAVPSTLQTSDGGFALTIPIDSTRWIPSGEVGLYAQRAVAQFDSMDLLASP